MTGFLGILLVGLVAAAMAYDGDRWPWRQR